MTEPFRGMKYFCSKKNGWGAPKMALLGLGWLLSARVLYRNVFNVWEGFPIFATFQPESLEDVSNVFSVSTQVRIRWCFLIWTTVDDWSSTHRKIDYQFFVDSRGDEKYWHKFAEMFGDATEQEPLAVVCMHGILYCFRAFQIIESLVACKTASRCMRQGYWDIVVRLI